MEDTQDPQQDATPQPPMGIAHEGIVEDIDAKGAIDLDPHGDDPLGPCMVISIPTLQAYRPVFTHAVLADSGIRAGRDFVVIFRGTVTRGHVC